MDKDRATRTLLRWGHPEAHTALVDRSRRGVAAAARGVSLAGDTKGVLTHRALVVDKGVGKDKEGARVKEKEGEQVKDKEGARRGSKTQQQHHTLLTHTPRRDPTENTHIT